VILGRKNFFRLDYKENWKFVDLRDYESKSIYAKKYTKKTKDKKGVDVYTEDEYIEEILPKDISTIKNLEEEGYYLKQEGGIIDTELLARFLATRTDCIFMLDEGQDVFDSNKKSGQIARQSITRTRHMHKTLILISQRAQAVDVNVRANCTYFYMCVKRTSLLFPTRFRVFRTDDVNEISNYPIWVRHNSTGEVTWQAPLWHSGFAKQYIYDAYDSWYMRQNMIRSQDIKVDAYELSFGDKMLALGDAIFGKKKPKKNTKKTVLNKDKIELSTPKKILVQSVKKRIIVD
jgi:hypothetical protein